MPPKGKKRKSPSKPKVSSHLKEWVRALLIALVLLILLRFFAFDLVSIPDSSMERSLLSGDIVLVNKYTYGTRMPMRILPHSWMELFLTTDTIAPPRQLSYRRMPSRESIGENDLILFNTPALLQQPVDKRLKRIRRVVALPGETVEMKTGELWVEGLRKPLPENAQSDYKVQTRRGVVDEAFLDLLELNEGRRDSGNNSFIFPLTRLMADSVARMPGVLRMDRFICRSPQDIHPPYGKRANNWTPDNFGPLTIPFKGMTLELTPQNLDKYFYHIRYHEGAKITLSNDSVFLNGKHVQEYVFRMNYFFVLGDNRHNTSDSRMWGLVPEDHITGKVSTVVFSFDKRNAVLAKPRWQRWFTSI